jgi:hypothetical protein
LKAARVVAVAGACALGSALGLASCETVDLGAPPADVNACRPSQNFFYKEIWPNVLNFDYGGKHCWDAKCHDPGSGRRPTFIPMPKPTPMVDANGDLAEPLMGDWEANYRNAAEEMNCSSVGASLLIEYGEGGMGHPGGALFKNTDAQETKLRMWVTAP